MQRWFSILLIVIYAGYFAGTINSFEGAPSCSNQCITIGDAIASQFSASEHCQHVEHQQPVLQSQKHLSTALKVKLPRLQSLSGFATFNSELAVLVLPPSLQNINFHPLSSNALYLRHRVLLI